MEPSLPYQGLSVNGPAHSWRGMRIARSNTRARGVFPRYIKTINKQESTRKKYKVGLASPCSPSCPDASTPWKVD